jgi:hypothetical protein
MKLSELLGRDVVSTDGDELGVVHDALLVQDGPVLSGAEAAFRLHALAIGRGSLGIRLGFREGHVEHPAVLRHIGPKLAMLIPWGAVVGHDEHRLTVDMSRVESPDPNGGLQGGPSG